nr:RNA-directed DNA polymerase, eukaryota, reverse transcriptase zinc-binding domain protein [Tanacetum cinerariifolium]
MIFKVDFEKAYDSVRWDFIDDILRRFGFGEKWCKWIQSCLNSSRGSVLVNGSPTKEFQFHKGLFNGIKLDSSLQISHLFYADDAIFMGQWSQSLHGEDEKIGKKVQPSFITPKLGNGVNTSFWDVAWCGYIAFKNLVPRLYALKSMKNVEVASKLSHGGLEFSFRRNPRGGVEQAQFERLKEMVEGVTLSNLNDRWSWSLVSSGDFSMSSVIKLIDNAIF